ncbi:MAG: alpha/beta hydrolase [Gaiellaceae bacterium]
MTQALAPSWARAALVATAAFIAVGIFGVVHYVDNYWTYRGFAPPRDAAFVKVAGTPTRFYVASPALGGRRQPVDVYLPPGYALHPARRYPVLYLLHGVPGRPGAFLQTVRMGVVEDELVALHRARPAILVMPFGSTGSFTDKEWANGIGRHEGWATFVARDLVHAVDARYRTIASQDGRAIGGLSEGGYGAINIAVQHPREFKFVESWSGYEQADPIRAIFGTDRTRIAANSPAVTIPDVAATLRARKVRFWFYTGTEDTHFRAQNVAFASELSSLGISHRFYVVRGGHNWAIWRGNAAKAYLAFSRGLGAA